MSRLKMQIAIANTPNTATLEVDGTDEWFAECAPHIGTFLNAVVDKHGRDEENALAISEEINQAQDAVVENQNFEGRFVKVTRMQFAAG